MGRLRHAAALLLPVLLVAAFARPAGAAPTGPTSTVVLSLAQRAGTAAQLHSLARTPLAPAAHGAFAAHAAAARLSALAALAPEQAHQSAVTAFARAHGLAVTRADGWTVTLSGPAEVLAQLFGTTLTHGRATSPLAVPAALRADVSMVSGLDDRPLLRPHALPFKYAGPDLRTQYSVPQSGWTGTGVTVGTMNLTGWDPADLTSYASAAGLPIAAGQVLSVPVDAASPTALDGSGDDLEVAMDAETILATAPQAKQRMYFAPNSAAGMVDAFSQMATDGAAGLLQVASTSWGMCEGGLVGASTYTSQVGQAIDRMLAAGVTLYAAAGDEGIYDCSSSSVVDNSVSVDFPASYPGTVGVGGTTISSLGGSESVWGSILPSPGTSFAGYGGGGGRSVLYSRPSYQQGVGSGTQRMVPDVASVGDPSTGLAIYNRGTWYRGGGTSLGAPTWAGLTAAALSGAGRTTGLGDVHAALYAHPEAFHDVVQGSNGYAAGTGYDLASGLGTPVWSTLAPLLTGVTPPTTAPAPAPTPVDTAAPTTTVAARLYTGADSRVLLAWAGHDPAPSAGLGPSLVTVTQVGLGTVWSTRTTATSQVLRLTPGRTYILTVRSTDLAGHTGPAAATRVSVPYDDASYARRGTWGRWAYGADYLGSHLGSRTRGSTTTMTVVGRSISLGFVRSPAAGLADVYVDGHRVARLDLYATTTLRRQMVRVYSATAAGRHTVRIVVLGVKRSTAKGAWVWPDSLLAIP